VADSAFSDPPKRPPGRPKGLPKTGGRRKGVNRHAPELRAFIDQRGRPLEFLAAIAAGRKLTAADPADPTKTTRLYPSLEARAAAARSLLNKLLPDLKATELTGADGGPIATTNVNDFDLARRLAFLLASATVEHQPVESPWALPARSPEPVVEPLPEPEPAAVAPESPQDAQEPEPAPGHMPPPLMAAPEPLLPPLRSRYSTLRIVGDDD
jgi:hypothetical protein